MPYPFAADLLISTLVDEYQMWVFRPFKNIKFYSFMQHTINIKPVLALRQFIVKIISGFIET